MLVEALGRKQEITLPGLRRLGVIKTTLPGRLGSFRQAIGVRGARLTEADAEQAMRRLDLCAADITEEMTRGAGFDSVDAFETAMAAIIGPAVRLGGPNQAPMIEIIEPEGRDDLTDIELAGLLPVELLRFAEPASDLGMNAPWRERLQRYLGMRGITVRRHRGALNGELIGNGQVPVAVLAYDGTTLKGPAAQVEFLRSRADVFAGRIWPAGRTFPVDDLSRSPHKPFAEDALVQSLVGEILAVTGLAEPARAAYQGCIVHLCCHYYTKEVDNYDQSAPFLSFDDLRKNISVYALNGAFASVPRSLGTGAHQEARYAQALVVLNACATAATAPFTEGLLRLLFARGFRHVIASETLIPDSLSSAFITRFYDALTQRMSIGESLLWARRSLATCYLNPGGLLYTMYGDPTLRLAIRSDLATPSLAEDRNETDSTDRVSAGATGRG